MKFWMCALVLLLTCGFVGTSFGAKAAAGAGKAAAKPLKAKLVSVDGQTITVEVPAKKAAAAAASPTASATAKPATEKVEVETTASLTLDGTPITKLSDIPVGSALVISPATGKATAIIATSPKGAGKAKKAKPAA